MQDWRTFAKSVGSPAPQRGEHVSANLEQLLTVDPYAALVKPKKTTGTRETSASKGLAMRDSVPEFPVGSQPSSGSGSSAEVQQEESSEVLPR